MSVVSVCSDAQGPRQQPRDSSDPSPLLSLFLSHSFIHNFDQRLRSSRDRSHVSRKIRPPPSAELIPCSKESTQTAFTPGYNYWMQFGQCVSHFRTQIVSWREGARRLHTPSEEIRPGLGIPRKSLCRSQSDERAHKPFSVTKTWVR